MFFLLCQGLVLSVAGQNAVMVAVHNGQSSLEEGSVLVTVIVMAIDIRIFRAPIFR
jgi:hypothetical protein